jgi:hypothetical protein
MSEITLQTLHDLIVQQGQEFRQQIAALRVDVAAIRADIAPMRAQLDGLPIINRRTTVIEQEVRMLRAAFNDFARTNPTSGEIQALHDDVNRVQAENTDLAVRLATVERLLKDR